MLKVLTIIGLVVALAMLVIFAADAFAGWPFQSASPTMDYGFMVASLLLGYVSVTTLRELP
ncbi:MAG: hypothetical protein K8U03_13795 [Planctomycetia bacterium]|nr:hypothetical protein [Planctomycetia bacterium]